MGKVSACAAGFQCTSCPWCRLCCEGLDAPDGVCTGPRCLIWADATAKRAIMVRRGDAPTRYNPVVFPCHTCTPELLQIGPPSWERQAASSCCPGLILGSVPGTPLLCTSPCSARGALRAIRGMDWHSAKMEGRLALRPLGAVDESRIVLLSLWRSLRASLGAADYTARFHFSSHRLHPPPPSATL